MAEAHFRLPFEISGLPGDPQGLHIKMERSESRIQLNHLSPDSRLGRFAKLLADIVGIKEFQLGGRSLVVTINSISLQEGDITTEWLDQLVDEICLIIIRVAEETHVRGGGRDISFPPYRTVIFPHEADVPCPRVALR